MDPSQNPNVFHATTILSVRRNGHVAVAGDGQVTLGHTVMKGNARKVRKLAGGKVVAGFAGAAADARLDAVFRSLVQASDPAAQARAILG